MSNTFQVAKRQQLGTLASRKLRRIGQVPAVLYGHGEESVSLSIPADQVHLAIRHHAHVVDLAGDVAGTALLKSVQWDTFGQHVLHLDLIRVDKSEKVHTTVEVVLHGEAPGLTEGGVIKHIIHSLEIECPVQDIPESIEVKVNDLHLDGEIRVKDLRLAPNVKVLADDELVLVQCTARGPEAPLEGGPAPGAGGAEPEVIGRAAKEDEGD